MSDNSENRFRRAVKADPNELCPCGSGQLYKDCHGRFVDIIKEKKYSGAVSADGMAIAVLEYLDKATDWSTAKEIRSIGRTGDNEAALAYALYLLLRNRSPEDIEMGARELTALAQKNYPFAQYILGRCKEKHWYFSGWYSSEVVNWYIKAAKGGYRRAAINALELIEQGGYNYTEADVTKLMALALPEAPAETAAREKIEQRLAERCSA